MPEFDTYFKWLGIPPEDQPPDHYRLLGIPAFTSDADVIANAIDRQVAHVRTFALGPHSADSQRILNELAAARVCLELPENKTAYDNGLRGKVSERHDVVGPSEASATERTRVYGADSSRRISDRRKSRRLRRRVIGIIETGTALLVVVGLFVFMWTRPDPEPVQQEVAENNTAVDQAGGDLVHADVGRPSATGSPDQFHGAPDLTTGRDAAGIRGQQDQPVVGKDSTQQVDHRFAARLSLSLAGHTGRIYCVCFSPDGKRIVSGSRDNTLKVWDAETGKETLTLKGHTSIVQSVSFSANGKWIVSGSDDKTLKIWNAQTGQEIRTLKGHFDVVLSVNFSPDGKRIVSGSFDRTLKVWDAQTGQETLSLTGHSAIVSSVSFSPDGKRIVSGSFDRTLKVWDAQTGQETLTLKGHTSMVKSVSFSPDGKWIVSGSGDNTLKVWDAQTGQETLTLEGHSGNVESVSCSPDGRRIVSVSGDKTLKVWDAETGQETLSLAGHSERISSVSFSPEGKRVVSGGGLVKVWSLNSRPVAGVMGRAIGEPVSRPPLAESPLSGQASRHLQQAWADWLGVRPEFKNSLGMRMRLIPPGKFMMGSPPGESGDADERPARWVWMSSPFFMSAEEVTNVQYRKLMSGGPASEGTMDDQADSRDRPASNVSWHDAVAFCSKLSDIEESRAGWMRARISVPPTMNNRIRSVWCSYRLPTEAEWEYSARAGSISKFWWGEDASKLGRYAWIKSNSEGRSHRVGKKKSNPWGLFDLYGNVMEWCDDWHKQYTPGGHWLSSGGMSGLPIGRLVNPRRPGPRTGSMVVRGHSFAHAGEMLFRSAVRGNMPSESRKAHLGFRVVCALPQFDPHRTVAVERIEVHRSAEVVMDRDQVSDRLLTEDSPIWVRAPFGPGFRRFQSVSLGPEFTRGTEGLDSIFLHPLDRGGSAEIAYELDGGNGRISGYCGLNCEKPSASPLRFSIIGDGKLLWQSSAIQSPKTFHPFDTFVSGVRQLQLRVKCDDRNNFAWAVWVAPRLVGGVKVVEVEKRGDPSEEYLARHTPIAIDVEWMNGWGFGNRGRMSVNGGLISVDNKHYRWAIGAHPGSQPVRSSRVVYRLDGRYEKLAGRVALCDSSQPRSPVIFEVLGDGVELWRSNRINQVKVVEKFEVSLRNAKELELRATPTGSKGNVGCHTVWLDPVLTKAKQTPEQ
tara:strand:- start:127 stop:3696 length:3570 start_codon:yes stop_codon:yes gene_type:complete